jgi:Cof subfamily protein (haloacid dehalogenase superfamily)
MAETPEPLAAPKIAALIADVDGTLVTDDKTLTTRTIAAVARLHAAGIAFAVISSRPPRGLRALIEPLRLTTPLAGFNGGMIVRPDLSAPDLTVPDLTVIEQHLLAGDIAGKAVEHMAAQGVEIWVYSGQDWLVCDPHGAHVHHEEHTLGFAPTVVAEFGPALDAVGKIVGVSDDTALLSRCENEVRAALGDAAAVERSQTYYLDVTHPLANKGAAVLALAKLLNIPMAQTAVIGDGYNDVAMFAKSPLGIARGNAAPEVQSQARYVTTSNMNDGFALAVERYLLNGDST